MWPDNHRISQGGQARKSGTNQCGRGGTRPGDEISQCDHAHSGRRARSVGRPTAYRHSGAGEVQFFNAAGAQPPPGDEPGPGEAATVAQREGWWLVGKLSCGVAPGLENVLDWGLLLRPSSAVRRASSSRPPIRGASVQLISFLN